MRMLLFFCALIVVGVSSACRKQEPASVQATPPAQEQTEASTPAPAEQQTSEVAVAQPDPPPPPPTPAMLARSENTVRQRVAGDVDAVLTAELRNFIQQKHRMPATFAEFASLRLDSIPRPPAGKKWVIDTESLEVKAIASP